MELKFLETLGSKLVNAVNIERVFVVHRKEVLGRDVLLKFYVNL